MGKESKETVIDIYNAEIPGLYEVMFWRGTSIFRSYLVEALSDAVNGIAIHLEDDNVVCVEAIKEDTD